MPEPMNLLIIDGTLRGAWDERFDGRGAPTIYSRLFLPPDVGAHRDAPEKGGSRTAPTSARERFIEIALVEGAARGWIGAKPDKATRVHCIGRLAVRFTRAHVDMKHQSKYMPWSSSLAVEITEMEVLNG